MLSQLHVLCVVMYQDKMFLFLFCLLLSIKIGYQATNVLECKSIASKPYTNCTIGFNESVCLVCPIFVNEPGLTWEYLNSSRHLFRDGSAVYENETDKLGINDCHPTNYSLHISPASVRYSKVLSCSQRKISVTNFAVRRAVRVKLIIVSKTQTEGLSNLTAVKGSNISLQCVVVDGLSPILLKWAVNGVEEHTEVFDSLKPKGPQNFASSFSLIISQNEHLISCSVQGPHVMYETALIRIVLSKKGLLPWLPRYLQQHWTIIAVSLIAVLLSAFLVKILCNKRRTRHFSPKRALPPQPPAEVRRAVQSFFEDRGEETELKVFESKNVQVLNSLSTYGKRKRWTARLKNEPSRRVSCIVVTLSDDSNPKDWCEFRMFAAYLKLVPKHKHVATILATNIDLIPYQIIQEYVCNGSLQDFLKGQYSKLYTKSMGARSMDSDPNFADLAQVLKMCSGVIEALIFLEKHDLVHPGICSRKVLMDNKMTCKLYDCRHRYNVERELSSFLNKVTAPLEWLAPETLTELRFHSKSDVWSVGVFLWEVLSVGKTPYNSTNLDTLKVAVKTKPPLPEPVLSCEETYVLMKDCWELDADKRPTLHVVFENLQFILHDIELYETKPYEMIC